MIDLKDELDVLYELNDLRDRAKELREQGRRALIQIENTRTPEGANVVFRSGSHLNEDWISSDNSVEVALLVKVQNHKDMSEDETQNDESEASTPLKDRLRRLKLQENLFQKPETPIDSEQDDQGDRRIPVLVAARAMQALLGRGESVFSRAAMLCYYRIVRELYIAAPPDWTVGAARASKGGTTAFVTGECIRAIFAFEDAIRRTGEFFKQTRRLSGRFDLLASMPTVLEAKAAVVENGGGKTADVGGKPVNSPLSDWADRQIERMWFDWHISTNPREGNIALHTGGLENELFFSPQKTVDMNSVENYLGGLIKKLKLSMRLAQVGIKEAREEIDEFREGERLSLERRQGEDEESLAKRMREYHRAETAHKFAFGLVDKAFTEAEKAASIIEDNETDLNKVLDGLTEQFFSAALDIHRVLEPARRYIRTVLYREVAASAAGRFDAGELVFAAASYGAITEWKSSELLTRACSLLLEVLPENGRLPTTRPFHSTARGHRMIPIGCEMTRSLAQLLQKTRDVELEPKTVRRMLNIFEEKAIQLGNLSDDEKQKRIAWNFDGSPQPDKPCVWVTAVSVLAIDRVVRMLNERINAIIFKYFEVVKPEKQYSSLGLNDLIYPDHALSNHFKDQPSMALRLEQMRGHVKRVTLPSMYQNEKGEKQRVFSVIFYGPPGTGKTTLVEALALSSRVPLIRLSPSDLVVQGPAAIEARARAVFEALSMLTQVVIIFDEFEDVVGRRNEPKDRDEKIFQFLRMGMLPKLIKLHKSAQNQAFAYCLATNFLGNIDLAAKRKGRFDFHIPVYDPDPVSRAGLLLYRLFRLVLKIEKDDPDYTKLSEGLVERFLRVVEMTGYAHASSLADDYFRLPGWVIKDNMERPEIYKNEIPLLWYVLTGEELGVAQKEAALHEDGETLRKAAEDFRKDATNEEKNESLWLARFEKQISEGAKLRPTSLDDLWRYLTSPTTQTKAAGI